MNYNKNGLFQRVYHFISSNIYHGLRDLQNAFSPEYSFAGGVFIQNSEEGRLESLVCFMGKKDNQKRKQQEVEALRVAKTRAQRSHIPSSIIGEDGKPHHINRYKAVSESEETPPRNIVRETLEAIKLSIRGDRVHPEEPRYKRNY